MPTHNQRKEPKPKAEGMRVMTQQELNTLRRWAWLRFAAALCPDLVEHPPSPRLH